uniref:Uncharacterized protein n=1 Tax=Arundo donax TaxID=35708 RepID=A0A0A8YTL0_ARUDO
MLHAAVEKRERTSLRRSDADAARGRRGWRSGGSVRAGRRRVPASTQADTPWSGGAPDGCGAERLS